MKTSKPISGISYNTPSFLTNILQTLRESGRISDAFWIQHEPDTDGTKPHFHLVVFTCGSVDPMALARAFDELPPGETKPLKFKPNPEMQGKCLSVSDWLLYAVHDEFYLDCKGLARNVHYSREDVRALDDEHLFQCWANVPPPRVSREQVYRRLVELIAQGLTAAEIFRSLSEALFQHPELTNLVKTLVKHTPDTPARSRRRSSFE